MPAIQNDVAIVHDLDRHDLLAQLALARQHTDELFSVVKPDSLYERPISERHRIIFYIGHLEAFDWNLFRGRVFNRESFHPQFDRLFAFGIDPVGGGLPTDQPSDWPSIAAVRDYVGQIRNILDDELADALFNSSDRTFDGFPLTTLLNVAIEHRLMHAETLAYMLHQLPLDRKIPQPDSLNLDSSPIVSRSIDIPAGSITLGLSRSSGVFGWDNEFESHIAHVPAFAIDQHKVTNGDYLDFIADGGYDRRELWVGSDSAAGRKEDQKEDHKQDRDWDWKSQHKISHPAFWMRRGNENDNGKSHGEWFYRTMFQEIPLPKNWPVYVSQAEAKAYAKWAGKRLPSEAEWQRAAYATSRGEERDYPWGNGAPASDLGNFDFANWSPVPVTAFPRNQSGFGVHGMLGNGWEWTSTEFAPFHGFQAFPFYRGYSADFFDGKHFVMKGGSSRTAASILRRTFRNWFQPHYQYMYAGFRCVRQPSSGDRSST